MLKSIGINIDCLSFLTIISSKEVSD